MYIPDGGVRHGFWFGLGGIGFEIELVQRFPRL